MSVPPDRARDEDFVSTDELVQRRGAVPLRSVEDLTHEDPFSGDQEYVEFLRDLYESRRTPTP